MSEHGPQDHQLTRPLKEGCLSDLRLDQLLAEELKAESKQQAREHLDDCPSCTERLRQLKEPLPDGAEERIMETIRKNKASPSRGEPGLWYRLRIRVAVLGTALVALVLALWLQPDPPAPVTSGGQPIERSNSPAFKGGAPWFGAYALKDGQPVLLAEGDSVRAGEQIQFAARCTGTAFLAVYGRDGDGPVTLVAGTEGAVPCAQQGEGLLAAVKLDDSPDAELFFALFCDRDFDPHKFNLSANGEMGPGGGEMECQLQGLQLVKE